MFSELDALVGKRVVMGTETPSGRAIEYEGVLLSYNRGGLAIETKDGPRVVEMFDVLDIREVAAPGKIVRRTLRAIPEAQSRQHLADRHAISWSLLKASTPRTAKALHDAIDHSDLGHRHRPEGE